MIINLVANKIENKNQFAFSLIEFNRIETFELDLKNNLLTKLSAFFFNKLNTTNAMNEMELHFGWYKIEKIEEFLLSFKDLNRLENFKLLLNNNLLRKLPAFSISPNNTSNVM
jgi:hypothetical protein